MTQTQDGLQTAWPTKPAGVAPPRKRRLGFMRELPALVVVAFALAILIKTFLIQAFYIPSESMEPTLHGCTGCSGDRILVNKLAYRFRSPRRGEVVVFIALKNREHRSFVSKVRALFTEGLGVTTPNETDFVKRIIGLPGDTIRVTEKYVYITPPGGKRFRLDEPYINEPKVQGGTFGPFKVPPGRVFVMGDNRAHSSDSRYRGPFEISDIIGKVFVRIWPPRRSGVVHTALYANEAQARRAVIVPVTLVPALGAPWIARRRRRDARRRHRAA